MKWGPNQLTDEIRAQLKYGSKVKFKWHGNSSDTYVGRIEEAYGVLYFVSEHNYVNDELPPHNEGMRYYNRLDDFYHFTYFEII